MEIAPYIVIWVGLGLLFSALVLLLALWFWGCDLHGKARCDASESAGLGFSSLTPIAKSMNRFAVCSDPRAERPKERPKDRKDDQRRNDRVVQIGPDGLAA